MGRWGYFIEAIVYLSENIFKGYFILIILTDFSFSIYIRILSLYIFLLKRLTIFFAIYKSYSHLNKISFFKKAKIYYSKHNHMYFTKTIRFYYQRHFGHFISTTISVEIYFIFRLVLKIIYYSQLIFNNRNKIIYYTTRCGNKQLI